MKKITELWLPHPAHFICGMRCNFRMATVLNEKYVVSTVGEMPADEVTKKILKIKGPYQEIGLDRLYETMVFKVEPAEDKCCPFKAVVAGGELDFAAYNSAEEARKGHYLLIKKWKSK